MKVVIHVRWHRTTQCDAALTEAVGGADSVASLICSSRSRVSSCSISFLRRNASWAASRAVFLVKETARLLPDLVATHTARTPHLSLSSSSLSLARRSSSCCLQYVRSPSRENLTPPSPPPPLFQQRLHGCLPLKYPIVAVPVVMIQHEILHFVQLPANKKRVSGAEGG
jgi:hypothetical protein